VFKGEFKTLVGGYISLALLGNFIGEKKLWEDKLWNFLE
jgi:hypothetical protein